MNTADKIKSVARSLFASQGYEATTMNEIAQLVGVKKPSLYIYFQSKEDLFMAIFEAMIGEYEVSISKMYETVEQLQSVEEQLYYLFENYILLFANHQEIALLWNRVLYFPPPALKDKIFSRIMDIETKFQKKMRVIIGKGMHEKSIRLANVDEIMFSFFSLREGALMAFLLNRELEKSKIKVIWEHYWLGIYHKFDKEGNRDE